ncbi:MAG: hypothetical protein KIH08_07520 [Candidatus Freyarchaeota archaeon]|nr:hypothetical protein [Candidatus Jordarchaeia archaeon]MBS7270412.1 hypothetical protein [Candidatus Jordarchaeia archaeon]MBS7280564.1 hypothetical protein [Candidatus Jordarchaeia archaeon]
MVRIVEEPKENVAGFRRVYISMSALKTIFQESKKSSCNETGGALVGTVSGDKLYVMEASGPGPDASSTVASFSPDIRHLEDFVSYFEERGFLYVGQWHKHPPCIRGPSGGDEAQIMEIVKDNPHLNFFVNIISNPIGLGFRISAKMFFRDEITRFGFPRIEEIELFLEGDATEIAMLGMLADKKGSDIVLREIETDKNAIVETAENQLTPAASISKDTAAQRRLRGVEKGLISEIYGRKAALLEKKILSEKNLMEALFPEFELRVEGSPGRLFWFTIFHTHEVAIVLEKNGTYTILINPEVEKINLGVNAPKSALVAALIAKASILQAASKLKTGEISKAPSTIQTLIKHLKSPSERPPSYSIREKLKTLLNKILVAGFRHYRPIRPRIHKFHVKKKPQIKPPHQSQTAFYKSAYKMHSPKIPGYERLRNTLRKICFLRQKTHST